jgi:hypothetical protein
LVLAAVLVVVLYLARTYAHRLILSLTHFVRNALRLTARSIMSGDARLKQRNREVLLAEGAEAMERKIEREFERINTTVTHDLEAYPAMHRSMSDLITRIDEDYRESTETPPSPPGWVNAVEAVAGISATGDRMVVDILGDIKNSLDRHHKGAMDEYRAQSRKRHGLLEKMMPYWRSASKTLGNVDKTINSIVERSVRIDNMMKEYEQIRSGTDTAVRTLSSSQFTQFFISAVVMLIALGGGIVNFNLIALPMSEMVGGGTYLGPFKMSHIAAMVIILVEVAMGIYLMEALRITRLFPIIGHMEDRKRLRFMWAALIILIVMACVESSLAFMRDVIAGERLALIQVLAEKEGVASTTTSLIPMVGQMVMGFVLPFALAFVAIPFESFVHSGRTVLGEMLSGLLRFMAFLFRLIGNIFQYAGNILINIYDLLAFPLLFVERLVHDRVSGTAGKGQEMKGGEAE